MVKSLTNFFNLPPFNKKFVIGICAMDAKARSRPMRNILERILANEEFEVVSFGDKVILDEDIENWPICDYLISFFSTGFPLDKAIKYVELRKPFLVNDLWLQKILWDRRLVLSILEAIGVPTPRRLILSKDGGPKVEQQILDRLSPQIREKFKSLSNHDELEQIDGDTIRIGGVELTKPFVEKPVYGENHNVNIYYHSEQGGGTRRLFRKVANKSSSFEPDNNELRTGESFIYEEFINVDNAEDIKVYTVGPNYFHAETRKSPVVDGVVRRNVDGKEMRFLTELSPQEQEMARKVCLTFGQSVCGLDLLRMNGQSYVIDVNGWSFVKGNDTYYDNCAQILRNMFLDVAQKRWLSQLLSFDKNPTLDKRIWTLKGFISVFRHADRTPKQKAKFKVRSSEIEKLLDSSYSEVTLRKPEELKKFEAALHLAIAEEGPNDHSPLNLMKMILDKKSSLPGTKVQLKPSMNKTTGLLDSVQVIIKWGGEFTHAAVHHSRDLGQMMRKDLSFINKNLFQDVKIFSSSERRVIATAEEFTKAFLDVEKVDEDEIVIKKDLLDDSNNAKEMTDRVKVELRNLITHESEKYSSDVLEYLQTPGEEMKTWHPKQLANSIKDDLNQLRLLLRANLKACDQTQLDQLEWCCNENVSLFIERWEKLIKEFCDVDDPQFNPGKVCELYDSLKYDALHNRDFIERMFSPVEDKTDLSLIKHLYKNAKIFFDLVAPREYGLTNEERLAIGMAMSKGLLNAIIKDLETCRDSATPLSRLYFTKESHIHTLLNIVLLSNLPICTRNHNFGEMDYLSQITFELYEGSWEGNTNDTKEYSLRLGFSPGAYHSFIMDLEMDDRHALSVAPRKDLTDHMDLEFALEKWQNLCKRSDWSIPIGNSNEAGDISPIAASYDSPTILSPILSSAMDSIHLK